MKKIVLLLILSSFTISYSQSKFHFLRNSEKEIVQFRLINNLIVFPLKINGKELSFILDTGVNKTILFNLTEKDSLVLNNTKTVLIRGLGAGDPIEAILSKRNNIRIQNIFGGNQEVYVILDDTFKLSSKMGTTIHGIIGYDLLKDVVVKVNYNKRNVTFYKPKSFDEPDCKSCEKLNLEFYRNKPYVNINVSVDNNSNNIPVKMLIDSGGSDAIWLFEGTKNNIKTPEKHFVDILGEGLSGTIYGKRSRVQSVRIGKYNIEKPTASFLDTVSTFNARKFKDRNGSIGGGILKRFKVWIDYPNQRIILKKAQSLKKGFYYNMSGLSVVYNGLELVKEVNNSNAKSYDIDDSFSKVISFVTNYQYRFEPSYKIERVVEGSPAEKAGLLSGDVLKSINGKKAYHYNLEEIMALFQTKPNRKISLVVERGVVELKYKFKLEQRI